jgi:hypothetical protein
MIQLSPEHKRMCANIARQYPEFTEFVAAWRAHELEQMAMSSPDNFGTCKGRIQTLTELQRTLKP